VLCAKDLMQFIERVVVESHYARSLAARNSSKALFRMRVFAPNLMTFSSPLDIRFRQILSDSPDHRCKSATLYSGSKLGIDSLSNSIVYVPSGIAQRCPD
jgi:hypothetical protein